MTDTLIHIRDDDPNNPGQKIGRLLVDTGLVDPSTGHLLFVPGMTLVGGESSPVTLSPCKPVVSVSIDNFSNTDAGLLDAAQLSQPDVEVKQPTAGQLNDFNDDGKGDVLQDPSSPPPFDGRVARLIQVNLSSFVDECLADDDLIALQASVTYTRRAQTPPTVSDDGSIIIANSNTDVLMSSTLIMGGDDMTATVSVSMDVTKGDLVAGHIVVLIGLQTQDGTLPTVNGVDWENVSASVSASTSVMCPPKNLMRVQQCTKEYKLLRGAYLPVTDSKNFTLGDAVASPGSTDTVPIPVDATGARIQPQLIAGADGLRFYVDERTATSDQGKRVLNLGEITLGDVGDIPYSSDEMQKFNCRAEVGSEYGLYIEYYKGD